VRLEIAHVSLEDGRMSANGTQIGISEDAVLYEVRYTVDEPRLRVELVGGPALELELAEGCDHFDLAYSPVFNSFPVLRHGLHRGGPARDFVMTFVSVPDLGVSVSRQRYDPLNGEGRIHFSAGDFQEDIDFDDEGFVVHYPSIADRVALEV